MFFQSPVKDSPGYTYRSLSPQGRAVYAAIAAGLCLCGCSTSHKVKSISDGSYKDAIAAAKKSGLPVSGAELAKPLPPASQNAAPIYEQLIQTMKDSPLEKQDAILDTYGSEMHPSPADTQEAAAALTRRQDLVTIAHQAAAIPKCVFDRPWASGDIVSIPMPELAKVRQAMRLISTESQVMAHQGQAMSAVRNDSLGFRLAHHAESDGVAISLLVRMAIELITLRGLQKIMVTSNGDGQVARAAADAIDKNWTAPQISPIVRRETGFEISIIEQLRESGPKGLVNIAGSEYKSQAEALAETPDSDWNDILNRSGMYLLVELNKIGKAVDLPFPTAFAREKALEAAQEQEPQSPRRLVCAILLLKTSDIVSKRAMIIATARATRAGAAVLSYRAAHGSLPATLSDAMPSVPADPFDLKPMRYRREGDGFVIYSVGPTLEYDGGTAGEAIAKKEIAFRYP